MDGEAVSVRNGAPVRNDGTICGSVLTMGGALQNAARWTGKRPEEIAALATTAPARLAGIADRKGALLPGMEADIAIFDERFDVQATIVGGALVYAAPGFEAAG
jgi:N-acetylglucosamine-6-phosphate deacetylase